MTNKILSHGIDMKLKNSDLTEDDFKDIVSVERLISILASPGVTETHLKTKCAISLLTMYSDKMQFEETLLSIFVTVQETFKNIVETNNETKLN